MNKLLLLIMIMLSAVKLSATAYYVDNCIVTGNDSNNGTSKTTPWLTLGHMNSLGFNPDDTINLEGGCQWREQFSPNFGSLQGTSGHPVIVQSYGSGQAIINGSDALTSGWSNAGSNIWTHSVTTQPPMVFFNGTLGTLVGSQVAVNSVNKWYWAANVLSVYSTSDPASAFTSPGIESISRDGIAISNVGYVTVNNIAVTKTKSYGFNHFQAVGMTISNNTITYSGERAISFYGGACNNFNAFGNTVVWAGGDGIGVGGCGTGGNIYRNDVSHCGMLLDDRSCISVSGSTGTVSGVSVYSNHIHDNEDQTGSVGTRGIIIDSLGTTGANYVFDNDVSGCNGHGIQPFITSNVVVYNNVVYNNFSVGHAFVDGIQATQATNLLLYNNTIYNNTAYCIEMSNTTGETIKNNLCLDAGSDNGIIVYDTIVGLTMDYNLFYGWHDQPYRVFVSGSLTNYSTPAALYAATGFGQHDLILNPYLANPAGLNLRPSKNSPAIDAGANLGSTYQLGLNPHTVYPYGTANQNSYGTGWDMGAFVFVPGNAWFSSGGQ